MRKGQTGVMLLEALIAILIFSLGVLGIVGLQASAVKASRDAKYRTDAGLLANELIGEMWSGDRSPIKGADGLTALQRNFQGDCNDALACSHVVDRGQYLLWRARVRATLPGADTNDPFVYVGPVDATWLTGCPTPSAEYPNVGDVGQVGPPITSTQVCVVVRWQSPGDAAVHKYITIVKII